MWLAPLYDLDGWRIQLWRCSNINSITFYFFFHPLAVIAYAPVAEGWIGIAVIRFVWMRKNVEIGRMGEEGGGGEGDVATNNYTMV